jgi:hypothetical protein
MGSLRFHVIVRGQRIGVRPKDLDSQAIREYKGRSSSPRPNFRITAKWRIPRMEKTIDVPNVLGRRTRDQRGDCGLRNQRPKI